MKNINTELAKIANTHLGIETLETRKSDSLDFHDCSVWGIAAALEAAYNAGLAAGVQTTQKLVGKIVQNDGKALSALLAKFDIGPAQHSGSFVFGAKMNSGQNVVITTEPVGDEYEEIEIKTISIFS